ncbi:MAG: GAF domain-containing protein, partial [Anaerolineae bacterium]|nr:GAF domain-containing protein [Anaerolineae bacterium]
MLLLAVLPVVLVGGFLLQAWTNTLQDELDKEERNDLLAENTSMVAFLQGLEADTRLIAADPHIEELAAALALGDEAAISALQTLLEAEFVALSASRPVYDQLRVLSGDGVELVRVDYDFAQQQPIVIPRAQLQDKSDRGYFRETIRLDEGELYISALDLNQEGSPSAIEGSLPEGTTVPSLRYGTPVYIEDGQGRSSLVAVVVLNVNVQSLLELVQPNADDAQAFLVNSEGYYLKNSANPLAVFGFMSNIEAAGGVAGARLQAIIGEEAFGRLQTTRQGVQEADLSDGRLMYYQRLQPPGAPDDYYWLLVNVREESAVFAPVREALQFGILALVGLVAVVAMTTYALATSISRPVQRLNKLAATVAKGEFVQEETGTEKRQDEIGELGRSFSQMTNQLAGIVGTLEARVATRTRDLQSVVDISNQVGTLLDLERLLQDVSDLTRDRFQLYHAHIYLLDEGGHLLTLAAGAGYVGRQMVAEQRQIPLDSAQSIVANAARTREPVTINDTRRSPLFLPHPLLPDTRSELAVALVAQGQVVGVLDVQASQTDFFAEDGIFVFEILAGQIAASVRNARLFDQSRRRARELQTVAELSAESTATLDIQQLLQNVANSTKQRFGLYHAHIYLLDDAGESLVLQAGAGSVGRSMTKHGHSISLGSGVSLVARAAREQQPIIVNDTTQDPSFLPNPLLPDTRAEMALPLVVGDEVLGVLDVQSEQRGRFTAEDIQIKSTLASQVAIAVQNARSFNEAEGARQEARVLFELSRAINAARTAEELLLAVRQQVVTEQELSLALLVLDTENPEKAQYAMVLADWRVQGSTQVGDIFALSEMPQLALLDRRNLVVVPHVAQDSRLTEASSQALQQQQIASFVLAPLAIGARFLGLLTFYSEMPHDEYTPLFLRLLRNTAEQVAAALDRIQLTQQMTQRANELQTVAEVGAEAAAVLDVQRLLDNVSNLTQQRFTLYHAHIYLLDETGEQLVLAAGAGEAGRQM